MHRSHWDLEVYVRDFQERRLTEAARSRLAAEAVSAARRLDSSNPFSLAIARLVNAWKSKGVSRRTTEAGQPRLDPDAVVTASVVPHPSRATQRRLAQPYADTIVIARGPMAGVTEQSFGVRDC